MEVVQDQSTRLPIVLIIDDNPTIRHLIAWSLEREGFQPIEAANGLEAFQWMEYAASELLFSSVILLDLAMPGMDGYRFLEWMQSTWVSRHPTPSIIVMTASHLNTQARPLPPLVKQVVAKPFHLRDLMAVIRLALSG